MIAEPGSAMIVELASQLAVPPYNRLNNPFVNGLLFKNLRSGGMRVGRGEGGGDVGGGEGGEDGGKGGEGREEQ